MAYGIYQVAKETLLLLTRDRIFLPAALAGALFLQFAQVASEFGIQNFTQIMFDVGNFGFHLTGAIVAILWGSKMIADSRQEGSIEVQLSSPLSRPAWLVGKYLGLSGALIPIGLLLLAVWNVLLYFNRFPLMTEKHAIIYGFMILGWLVIASSAVLFSAVAGSAVALFCTFTLWVSGLIGTAVFQALPGAPGTEMTREILKFISRIWDLQRFNLSEFVLKDLPPESILWDHGLYGICLIVALLTFACLFFTRRDLIN